jgi:phospholipase/carboxylesterase
MPGMAEHIRAGVPLADARVLCVLVHGRTQSPDDMQAAIIRHLQCPDVAFALPRAQDATWYHARAVDPLTDDAQADLARSRDDLGALVTDLRARLPGVPLVLAGFSQGACLSLEYAFAGGMPDMLVALTGCRVGVAGDDRPETLAPGLPVYLSAGDADPWIPLSAFAQTVADLGRGGAMLRADVFPGRPHNVSAPEIAMLDGVLTDLALGRAPMMGAAR